MSQVNDNTKRKESKHLTLPERETIERMRKAGASNREIARVLIRDLSTVKREIKRGSVKQREAKKYISSKMNDPGYAEKEVYFADTGQRVYEKRRRDCGARNKVISCSDMVKYVEDKILGRERWSPDAAIGYASANNLFEKRFTTKTFYNWIDDGVVGVKNIDLLLKVRRRLKSRRKERKRVLGKSIDERPTAVNDRHEFGHWEGDGIVGKNGKGHLITLVERKVGIGLLINAGNRESRRIVDIIDTLQAEHGDRFGEVFKTITFDNGAEFSDCAGMEKMGRTQIYYAHPYSAYERGTNENWNGIVRRFIPKGKTFDALADTDLSRIANYINTLPRKRFNYKSPLDLWNRHLYAIL